MIAIYNSLTRKKEDFVPQVPGEVRMYTCGVTVYDDCHVGHARSLYIFDVIRKYLEYRGFKVRFVRNITDIDDKIINRAKELNVDWRELVEKYIGGYHRDLEGLGIRPGDSEPRATEDIPEMIRYIQGLIEKGFAYEGGGDVYFAVRKFSGYGKLSGQALDEMEKGVRIDPSENKKDPLDFALWKKSREGEPSWPSPWGPGRPGWHIECSVMSQKFLKTDTLDIHAGGLDLIFPHHENEIAQAEALTGKPFARTWIHHGLLTIDGRKMSKSLGNFYTIQDVLKRFEADVLKLFFLSAHYRSAMDFTFEGLDNTKKAYEKIERFLAELARTERREAGASGQLVGEAGALREKFEKAMDDDFNTAVASSVLFELLNLGYIYLAQKKNMDAALFVGRELVELGSVLGLHFKASQKIRPMSRGYVVEFDGNIRLDERTETEVEKLVQERDEARKKKNFKKADEIRDQLRKLGVTVKDKERSA